MKYGFVLLLGIFVGSIWNLPYKFVLRSLFSNEYGRLVYICDSAMREHYISKSALLEIPSQDNIENLEIAEVALLDCQTYDVLRKKLLSYGLSEADLSLISLQFIERNSSDLLDVVEVHEINY